jgi:hypothetical protein
MNKNEKIKNIKEKVEYALSKYDIENVDIVKNEGTIDIMYHSRHNSFSIVDDVCKASGLSEQDIDKIADYYDIGYCW